MKSWIRCEAYFSERPIYGPFWIGIDEGYISDIRKEAPLAEEAPLGICEINSPYLLPLLSDTHAHVYMDPWPLDPSQRVKPGSASFEIEVENATRRLENALAKGIGLVRDMGDPHGINTAVRKAARHSPQQFPAYQIPGPAIHRPKKYGRFLGVARETIEDVIQTIDTLVEAEDIDFVKVVTTGIVNFAKESMNQSPQFNEKELFEVVSHAEKLNLRVASHCSGADGIDINLNAGVHFIEHAYFARYDQIETMLDRGLYWTPTFAPVYQQVVNNECPWNTDTRRSLYKILSQHNHSLEFAQQIGTPILAGTDAGSPGVEIGNGLFVELAAMARSLPWTEVLRIATACNADACSHPEYTGRIAEGHPASFSVFEIAPWHDANVLGDPSLVYQKGIQVATRAKEKSSPN